MQKATLGPELLVFLDPSPYLCFFCMQNSAFRTRITSAYGSQPSSVVFARKTVTFGPELQVSMVARPNLRFCVYKTTCLASDLLVSMGPNSHLWFLYARQRL